MNNAPSGSVVRDSIRGSSGFHDTGESAPRPDEDQHLLVALEERWFRHRKCGLEIRHEMGKELNDCLGEPSDRPMHDGHLMAAVAKRLKTSMSELYRMRWLAAKFGNVEELFKAHPKCLDWAKFNILLPQLIRDGDGSEKDSNQLQAKTRSRELRRRIADLRKRNSERRLDANR